MRCHLIFVVLALLATLLPTVPAFHILDSLQLADHAQPPRHMQRPHVAAPPTSNSSYSDCGSSDAVLHTISDPSLSFVVSSPPFLSGAWTFTVTSTVTSAVLFENVWFNGQQQGTMTYDWLRGLSLSSDGSLWSLGRPLQPDTYTYTFSRWLPSYPTAGDFNVTVTVVNSTRAVVGCACIRFSV